MQIKMFLTTLQKVVWQAWVFCQYFMKLMKKLQFFVQITQRMYSLQSLWVKI